MNISSYSRCFGTFSSELRFKIIDELSKKPRSVNELVKKTNVEQSRLSHSIAKLKQCGFVCCKTKGKERIYSLNENISKAFKKGKLVEALVSYFCNCNKKECK